MLNPAIQRDVLMVGTQTSLMVYDVEAKHLVALSQHLAVFGAGNSEENADLFFKEVHDGSCLNGALLFEPTPTFFSLSSASGSSFAP